MLSVKGVFEDGVARPVETIAGREGHVVIITFLEPTEMPLPATPVSTNDTVWQLFDELVVQCAVETGLADLAHQHDHYLYGQAKRD